MGPPRVASADLPRSLRRAANRSAIHRRPPRLGTRLYEASEAGLLTRANTEPGTRGRQAVDAVTRRYRREREPTLPVREALGHRVAGSRPKVATFYAADPPRRITIEGVTQRDVQRAGAYMHSVRTLIRDLREHPQQADRIKKRWESRARRRAPIVAHPLLATATAAILLAEQDRQTGEDPVFDSGRSRPGRRRRRPSPRRGR